MGHNFNRHFCKDYILLLSYSHSVMSFGTPWTGACQDPLSMGFPRQEHWSGLLFPSPGDLPDPGIEHAPPALQVDSLPLSRHGSVHTDNQFRDKL